jgi:hypothetical protein
MRARRCWTGWNEEGISMTDPGGPERERKQMSAEEEGRRAMREAQVDAPPLQDQDFAVLGGQEREALKEAERALRGARDGLDFGLGCARDLEGDNSPIPAGERSRRQDYYLKEARRSHAIVEAALAAREEPREPDRKGEILKIGTVIDGQPEGWEFRGAGIGLYLLPDGNQVCAGWTVPELEAISAAREDAERRNPALAIVEGLLRVVRGKVSESDAATDIEAAEKFLSREDTETTVCECCGKDCLEPITDLEEGLSFCPACAIEMPKLAEVEQAIKQFAAREATELNLKVDPERPNGVRSFDQWRNQFGGGMIPFDKAYWDAKSAGHTGAEAQALGVEAVLRNILGVRDTKQK